jgi:membrane associated rhomboid family serine protease
MSERPPSDPPSGMPPDAGGAAAAAPPVCYRHPDRETYIRCTRCERPICPECMTSAAVGFQCPDCVAEGRARTREGRTVLGGRVSTGGVVTRSLIGITVGCFVLQYLIGFDRSITDFALIGYAFSAEAGGVIGVAAGEYYRLLTAAFLHGGILHIMFNMWVLFALGPTLEQLLGRARFLILYLLCALGGSVVSYAFNEPNVPSVGASGAIFGLMGAILIVGRSLRADVTNVLVLIGINVAIGFVVPNIDWRAHLGGLITGVIVGAVFAYLPPVRRRAGAAVVAGRAATDPRTRAWVQAAALAPLVLIMVGVVAARTAALTAPPF